MKLTKHHFELFKKQCQAYQKAWELTGWKLNWQFTDIGDDRASVTCNLMASHVTVVLNTTWDETVTKYSDANLKGVAKHEMLHVFLAKLSELASFRYIQLRELDAAEHEMIQKLKILLPDV